MTDINVSNEILDGINENPVVEDLPLQTKEVEKTTSDKTQEGDAKLIGKISSMSYNAFTKILSLLTPNMGKTDIISIKEGELSTISGGGYLYCDLSILFGKHNFDIIDPQYNIKLMKLIAGGDEVAFIDDDVNSRYLISNFKENKPLIDITLAKPDPSMNPKITKPELGEKMETLVEVDADLVGTITAAEKNLESQYFIVSINENQSTGKSEIISISTDKETFKYKFKDSWTSDEGQELSKFKLFNPFPVAKPEEIDFHLYKSNSGEYWIKTSSSIGLATIEYMEKLTAMGIFDTYSL